MEIIITVDGVEVVGVIFRRTVRDLGVAILSPYINLAKGDYQSRYRRPFHDWTTDEGIDRAKELLAESYELGLYFDEHLEELKESVEMAFTVADEMRLMLEPYNEKRRAVKKRYKDGEIDIKTMNKLMNPIYKELRKIKAEINRIEATGFKGVPCSSHFAMEIIKGKVRYKP